MGKKLAICLAGLGVTLAVAGGVGGYFIAKVTAKTPVATPQTQEKVDDTKAEELWKDYALPDEFNYTSYSVYDIGQKYALFSGSSIGCYTLNKETKEFEFFNSSSVSSVSKEVDGFKYFWLSNSNLFKFNTQTGDHEIVALNSGVAFSNLSFLGSKDKVMFIKGYSYNNGSNYYFVAFDTEKCTSDVVELTNSQYNSIDTCTDLDGKYFLTRNYSSNSLSGGTYSSFLVDKTSKVITTFSDNFLYSETSYLVKNSTMYALLRHSSTTNLSAISLDDGTISVLKENATSYSKFTEYANGFVFSYVREVGGSSYSSAYGYYIDFSDNSVTQLTANDEAVYLQSYIVDGTQIFSIGTSSTNKYGRLATFNETAKALDVVYTALVSSSNSYSYCEIYEFNGKYYVSSDGNNFAEMSTDSNGVLSFKQVSLKCRPNATNYSLGGNKYLFVTEGLKFYDFVTDTYKHLVSTVTVKDISVGSEMAVIYASNSVKYELNLKTLSFKAVAYWEEVEE